MERKRNSDSEEDGCAPKKYRKRFTEVESMPRDDAGDEYFDETSRDEYQPQFFNYQLVGDLVAVEILNSKDLIIQSTYYVPVEPITRQRFCNVAWSVRDLLRELTSQKSCYPIAKKVMLAVGYNDCRSDSMNALMFVECLEKTVEKLRRRGCKEIILANVPPCGVECDNVNHWKYLQIINDEILKLSRKHDFIGHCDIFKLFCQPKNWFSQNSDYVACSEINYKIDFTMYNEGCNGEVDLINFSNLAQIVLGTHVAKTVEKRVEYLRYGPVDKIICVLEEASDVEDSDSEDEVVEIVETKNVQVVINLDSSDEDGADGERTNDSKIENEMPRKDVPVKREISSSFEKPDDINERIPSCETPPENEQPIRVISNNIKSAGDIKIETSSLEMPPQDERMRHVILCSIECVARDVKVEKSSEMPAESKRVQQVISCSIVSVSDIKDEKTSCELPQKDGKVEQKIVGGIEESERIKQEIVWNVEKSEPVKREIVDNVERSNDIKDEEPSCEISEKDERFEPVILRDFKILLPAVRQPSCETPQEDGYRRDLSSRVVAKNSMVRRTRSFQRRDT